MKVYDMRLKTGSTITVAGPSQSGKSTLVEELVKRRSEIFSNGDGGAGAEPISDVFWYCAYQPTNKISGVTYIAGLPNDIMERIKPNCLVVLDDYMQELANSSTLTSIMTKAVHHLPMTLIYITQNIFSKSNDNKTRRLNTNYLIIFKNPQDKSQVEYIGRQMYPRDKDFLRSAYEDATGKTAFSYLLIDSHQTTPDEVRVRTNIINNPMYVYVPMTINTT